MFGLGEKAGLNIEGEQPGLIADAPPSDGLGMMTSFGRRFFHDAAGADRHCFRRRQRRNAVLPAAPQFAAQTSINLFPW